MNSPYLIGVFLALNSVRDAFLLVDGPQCAAFKSEIISGKHDWRSSLFDVSGFHRVVISGTTMDSVTLGREDKISRLLQRVAGRPDAGVVMVASLTMCGLTGIQYGRIIRPLAKRIRKPFLEIPCDSLDRDWLDGYAAVWETIARAIALKPGRRKKNSVVVVGHLMDRNEADQTANLAELARMLDALSLKPAAFWPSGGCYAELSKAAEASAVISLPYAGEAGRILAKRLKVPLIETGLPFGMEASSRWVRTVAKAFNKEKAAEKFIEGELGRIAPPLEWAVPHAVLNRRLLYLGDPHLLEGFCELCEGLGARIESAAVLSRKGRLGLKAKALGVIALEEPQEAQWRDAVLAKAPFDLCVSSNLGWQVLGFDAGPVMEFGFPSYFAHNLAPRPFLGFLGSLHFTDRLVEHLMLARMRTTAERRSESSLKEHG